jgi:hypothetical protein
MSTHSIASSGDEPRLGVPDAGSCSSVASARCCDQWHDGVCRVQPDEAIPFMTSSRSAARPRGEMTPEVVESRPAGRNPVSALVALGFPRGEAELMVALIVGQSATTVSRWDEGAARATHSEAASFEPGPSRY